jgi:hypothetical protein
MQRSRYDKDMTLLELSSARTVLEICTNTADQAPTEEKGVMNNMIHQH